MTYRGHIFVGGLVATAVWRLAPVAVSTLSLSTLTVAIMVGSLAPDLDAPGSWLPRHVLGPFRYLLYLIRWTLSNPLTWHVFGRDRTRLLVGHRGFSHSLLGITLASTVVGVGLWIGATAAVHQWGPTMLWTLVPAWRWAALHALALWIGCGSHLFADAMTVSGVPILLPWSTRRFGIGPRSMRLHTH